MTVTVANDNNLSIRLPQQTRPSQNVLVLARRFAFPGLTPAARLVCFFWQIPEALTLHEGDSDQNFDFDQLDLVQVQVAAKYLSGETSTWGEGDWNGAPGGTLDSPPAGDGLFNQLDIVAAQQAGLYLAGPSARRSGSRR